MAEHVGSRLRRGRQAGHVALRAVRHAPRAAGRWAARQEAIVLASACLIVVALFGFVKIAGEVFEGETRHFDQQVLQMLRSPEDPRLPIGPVWLMDAAVDISTLGAPPLLIVVLFLVTGYLALEKKYRAMWLVLVSVTGGGLLNLLLKAWFGRGRPDVVPHLVAVTSPSFPSGHSVLVAVMYLTMGVLLARVVSRWQTKMYLFAVTMAITFLVGVSRVYLGVHYPTDVLAGWCVGLGWASICWIVAHYLQRRGAIEAEAET